MDLLELLCKRSLGGDVDFLRGAMEVLVDGIMGAEISAQARAMDTATGIETPQWALVEE